MRTKIQILLGAVVIYFLGMSNLLADVVLLYGVDSSSNNVNVVIKERNPIAFFKLDENYVGTSFEIKISTSSSNLNTESLVWATTGVVTAANTINNTTRIEIPSLSLKKNTTYYIQFTVSYYEFSNQISTTTFVDKFYTIWPAVSLTSEISLEVDYNNPFCPLQAETTKIRYMVKNKDAPVNIYLFSISGRYIKTLASHLALKDVVYTISWDGKDTNGQVLPQGMYIVCLSTLDSTPVIKYVGIIDKR